MDVNGPAILQYYMYIELRVQQGVNIQRTNGCRIRFWR